MSAPSHYYVNVTSDTAVPLADAKVLRKVIVGTLQAASTVTITETSTAKTITILGSEAVREIEFNIKVDGLIIALSDADSDVTVVYDA